MKKLLKILQLTAAIAVMASCGRPSVYNQCADTDENGWHIDSAVIFRPVIADTLHKYNMIVTVRHTSDYPYQNFWMFVRITSPDGMIARDPFECYLADNTGRFLGSGISVYEMPVLISENIRYDQSGEYKVEILQGMRDTLLTGVKNICLTLERVD
ncbi:MAG: gliding motility lipoprotein GldH [Bacteroidales bacterium]|nr:gliding motility lipoprotein GldH [Bacteroidales bacterium]MDY6426455.1 gliding motility lipoprotein GldH [Bacteroidales bacterium]